MKKHKINNISLYNCDNAKLMRSLENGSVDVILTDPPYLYLKNQKLERVFDETLFFKECARILSSNGFLIFFGRGVSFHRWNVIVDEIKLQDGEYLHISELKKDINYKDVFDFKEEIIWDKAYNTSPLLPLGRVHETISIFSKGASINRAKVPYLEMKGHDVRSVIQDIKRMSTILNNPVSLNAVLEFLENNEVPLVSDNVLSTSISSIVKTQDRCASVMNGIKNGLNEKTIIRTDFNKKTGDGITGSSSINHDRCVTVMQSVEFGLTERSIVKEAREHYSAIHPTQKPVRLLERLLALVIPKDKEPKDIVVADFFGGSFSTMEAVYNMGMKGISCEIDEEYFNLGKERIMNTTQQMKLF